MACYNLAQAQVQVTLAAIANAAVGQPMHAVRPAIIAQLARADYATKAEWSLVWGPLVGTHEDNMVYVARQDSTGFLSIVLRGTIYTITSFWEDVPTAQVACPFTPGAETKVSKHYLEAVQGMVRVPDETGFTLGQFLAARARETHGLVVFVAGHSQGASLVQIMLAWAMQQAGGWANTGETQLIGYASAPPSPGDPAFAQWLGTQASSFQIINPLDTIPFWYASIDQLIAQNVPEPLPHDVEGDAIRAGLKLWADVARASGPWQQAETLIHLRKVQLPASIGYVDQATNQHTHNSYLYLMDAPQTDIGPASFLPAHDETKC